MDAAIAELFHGGRINVVAAALAAVVVGNVVAGVFTVAIVPGVVWILPFWRKLRVRNELRSMLATEAAEAAGDVGVVSLAPCLVAANRGGLGGGGVGGTVDNDVDGQLLEFSEPLSLIVSELILFLRCAFGVAFVLLGTPVAFCALLVPQACALPVHPRWKDGFRPEPGAAGTAGTMPPRSVCSKFFVLRNMIKNMRASLFVCMCMCVRVM